MCANPEDVQDHSSKAPRVSTASKPMWMRFLAIAICVQCITCAQAGTVNWVQAEHTFNEQYEQWHKVFPKLSQSAYSSHNLKQFMETWFNRFREGDEGCKNIPGSGRPRLIPLDVAKTAAELVRKGKLVQFHKNGRDWSKIVFYPTIHAAVGDLPELQKILHDYDCSPEQLLGAMHAADPELVRRSITFKRALTIAEKAARVEACEQLLQLLAADPSLLKNMVFLDETTIVLFGEEVERLQVWCSKHDIHFHDVCPVPQNHRSKTVKVHVIAAVTAHPAFAASKGVVYGHGHFRHPEEAQQKAGWVRGCERLRVFGELLPACKDANAMQLHHLQQHHTTVKSHSLQCCHIRALLPFVHCCCSSI